MPEQKKDTKSSGQKAVDLMKLLGGAGTGVAVGSAAVPGIINQVKAVRTVNNAMTGVKKTLPTQGPVLTGAKPLKSGREWVTTPNPKFDKTGQPLGITSPVRAKQTLENVKNAKGFIKGLADNAVDVDIDRQLKAARGGTGPLSRFKNAVQNVKTNMGVGGTAAAPPKLGGRPGVPNMSFNEQRRPLRKASQLSSLKSKVDAAKSKGDLVRAVKDINKVAKGDTMRFLGAEISPGLTKAIQVGNKINKVAGPVMLGGSLILDQVSRADAARKADAAPPGPNASVQGSNTRPGADPNAALHTAIKQAWTSAQDEALSDAQRGQISSASIQAISKINFQNKLKKLSPEAKQLYMSDKIYANIR